MWSDGSSGIVYLNQFILPSSAVHQFIRNARHETQIGSLPHLQFSCMGPHTERKIGLCCMRILNSISSFDIRITVITGYVHGKIELKSFVGMQKLTEQHFLKTNFSENNSNMY